MPRNEWDLGVYIRFSRLGALIRWKMIDARPKNIICFDITFSLN
jgi:hypothetical protein